MKRIRLVAAILTLAPGMVVPETTHLTQAAPGLAWPVDLGQLVGECITEDLPHIFEADIDLMAKANPSRLPGLE